MSLRRLYRTTLLAMLLLVGAGPAPSTLPLPAVLEKLHEFNFAQEGFGELASRTSRSVPVQTYGKMLELDHAKADREVIAVAQQKGLTLTSTAKLKQSQKLLDQLKGAAPSNFDIEFLQAVVRTHKEALRIGNEARSHVKDADLQRLLSSQLRVLERHLKVGEQLLQESLAH